ALSARLSRVGLDHRSRPPSRPDRARALSPPRRGGVAAQRPSSTIAARLLVRGADRRAVSRPRLRRRPALAADARRTRAVARGTRPFAQEPEVPLAGIHTAEIRRA